MRPCRRPAGNASICTTQASTATAASSSIMLASLHCLTQPQSANRQCAAEHSQLDQVSAVHGSQQSAADGVRCWSLWPLCCCITPWTPSAPTQQALGAAPPGGVRVLMRSMGAPYCYKTGTSCPVAAQPGCLYTSCISLGLVASSTTRCWPHRVYTQPHQACTPDWLQWNAWRVACCRRNAINSAWQVLQ